MRYFLFILFSLSAYGQYFVGADPTSFPNVTRAASGGGGITYDLKWVADDIAGSDGSLPVSWTDQVSSKVATFGLDVGNFSNWITNSAFNGHKAIYFHGTQDAVCQSVASHAQPYTITFVAKDLNAGGFGGYCGSTNSNLAIYINAGTVSLTAGSFVNVAAPSAALHAYTIVVNGASSAIYVDGTSIATGDAGTGDLAGVELGGYGKSNAGIMFMAELKVSYTAFTSGQAASEAATTKSTYGIP
jgi:hypothetical protein